MHDSLERVLGIDARQEGGQRVTVGDVACLYTHLGTEFGQFTEEVGGAGGGHAAAADQKEVVDAVSSDEVPGDQGTETAGSAGDEDGAVWVPGVGTSPTWDWG